MSKNRQLDLFVALIGDVPFRDEREAMSAPLVALSKNKQKKEITTGDVAEILNLDQIQALLTEYFNWVSEIKSSKN